MRVKILWPKGLQADRWGGVTGALAARNAHENVAAVEGQKKLARGIGHQSRQDEPTSPSSSSSDIGAFAPSLSFCHHLSLYTRTLPAVCVWWANEFLIKAPHVANRSANTNGIGRGPCSLLHWRAIRRMNFYACRNAHTTRQVARLQTAMVLLMPTQSVSCSIYLRAKHRQAKRMQMGTGPGSVTDFFHTKTMSERW